MLSLCFIYMVVLGIIHTPICATQRCTMTPDVNKLLMKVGETVSIYCSSDEGSKVFRKDGAKINDERIEGIVTANERVLRIFNVGRSDEGNYTCSIVRSKIPEECNTITLKVYDDIMLPNENTEKVQYIMQGRQGSLTCTAQSDSTITYEWYVGDKKIRAVEGIFTALDGQLTFVALEKYNGSIFTCRAALRDFSYFKDLNITLGLLKGEPMSCMQCRDVGVGSFPDGNENCAAAVDIKGREQCSSSCVTINATGSAEYDGTYQYATIRGCGDKLSIFKERCITLPSDVIQLSALSMFGDATGLTKAQACFCSGDECNNEAKIYSTGGGTRVRLATSFLISTLLYVLLTMLQ